MSQVLITKSKLDTLAQTVANKAEISLPLTIDEMDTAIKNLNLSVGPAEPTLQNKTITPTTSSQSITADTGYDGLGTVTINPIPNNYIDTTNATATSNDIISGKTAYVNGNLVTGDLEVASYYISTNAPTSSQGEDGDIWLVMSGA